VLESDHNVFIAAVHFSRFDESTYKSPLENGKPKLPAAALVQKSSGATKWGRRRLVCAPAVLVARY
jgi:hypothetical protein